MLSTLLCHSDPYISNFRRSGELYKNNIFLMTGFEKLLLIDVSYQMLYII
ncbi:hypothetical protein ACRRTK_020351 [Alexandromys fortis]